MAAKKPKTPKLSIDPEFHSLLPPLSKVQRDGLRRLLQDQGCREPIIVWANHGDGTTIVDGHNRYEICCEDEIPFTVRPMKFDSRVQVIEWMCENQQYRRNWTDEQEKKALGILYNAQKAEAGRPEGSTIVAKNEKAAASKPAPNPKQVAGGKPGKKKPAKEEPKEEPKPVSTAQKLAEEHGVSAGTVVNAGKYDEWTNAIGKASPELVEAILTGAIKSTEKDVQHVAGLDAESIVKVCQSVPLVSTLKAAMQSAGIKAPSKAAKKPKKPSQTGKVGFADFKDTIGKLVRQVSQADELLGGATNCSRSVKQYLDGLHKAVVAWEKIVPPNQR